MADMQTERPRFYQGQYLGPEDLRAAVDHGRWARARHDLGAHTWGIAVGLRLREVDAPGGGIEAHVEPGYAIDGYGRPLVLTTAREVPAAALERLRVEPAPGEDSVAVPVWLRYTEEPTREPPYGFAVCEPGDARSRIDETYQLLVGRRSSAERHDPVEVAGAEIDPVEALRTVDDAAPLLCDASVPFQTFPEDPDRWWLVPLGYVRWNPAEARLVEATETDRRESRRLRRYLGVVAQEVEAADGVIRLRRRTTDPPAGGAVSTDEACRDAWPRPHGDLDLTYDEETGRVSPRELVWIEGDLRLAGDGRLFGGRLEFRDEHGDDRDVPMWIRRVEANDYRDARGERLGGRDLEVLVGGTSDPDGRNRLVIGAVPAEETDVPGRVVVQNDGRVGIGTLDPPSHLRFPLTVRAIGDGQELLGFEAPDTGEVKWHINQNLGGDADGLNVAETGVSDGRLFVRAGGNVGIGTTAPEAKLDVADLPPGAGEMWLRIGNGGDSGRVWLEYGEQLAPLLVLSDRDDPPRIRFQQIGDGEETAAEHSSWIGHARGGSSDLAIMNGNLGIGTNAPGDALDVRGNIRLGAAGDLFAVGGVDNLRLIAGQVGDDGAVISGDGFTARRASAGSEGRYRVDFDRDFPSDPVVLVSAVDSLAEDNVVTVRNPGRNGFEVLSRDVSESIEGDLQDSAFSFVALGLRS